MSKYIYVKNDGLDKGKEKKEGSTNVVIIDDQAFALHGKNNVSAHKYVDNNPL